MNDVLAFTVWAVYVALIVWAAAAISRRIDRRYDRAGDGR